MSCWFGGSSENGLIFIPEVRLIFWQNIPSSASSWQTFDALLFRIHSDGHGSIGNSLKKCFEIRKWIVCRYKRMMYPHLCKFHINVPSRHHLVIDVVSVVMASAILAPTGIWRLGCHIGFTWLGAILAPPGRWYLVCHISSTWLGTILAPPSFWCCKCPKGTTWPTQG